MQLKSDKIVTLYRELNQLEMNLQAEIKWIQSEISKVTDPRLIEAFKQLLAYRKDKESIDYEALDGALERSYEDKAAGRVMPHKDVQDKYKKWL